jgi:hypothetical protein
MRETKPWLLGRVGMALDYRLRYYFAVTPPDEFTARRGASLFLMIVDPSRRLAWMNRFREFFESTVPATTARLSPVAQLLGGAEERQLCQVCYSLALLEELYRAGPVMALRSPILPINPLDSDALEQLLAIDREMLVHEDLIRLSHAFYHSQRELIGLPAVLNPTFAGSRDVGNADADLIIDGCLIEVKTSVSSQWFPKETLYQLLGYVLLDYGDEHRIRSVGIYFARQATLVRWPVEQFVALLSDESESELGLLRKAFQAALTDSDGRSVPGHPPGPRTRRSFGRHSP